VNDTNAKDRKIGSQSLKVQFVPLGIPERTINHDVLAGLQSGESQDFRNESSLFVREFSGKLGFMINIHMKLGKVSTDLVWVHSNKGYQRKPAIFDQLSHSVTFPRSLIETMQSQTITLSCLEVMHLRMLNDAFARIK